ncbi:polysaccharide lyase family 8 super-sandwich domain-containing protein [Pedobacter glucosidilyticus]|uniref:polysaccharide lyase family 8 super-sandwich domain-containing protein n=1 Tax=Pedobacter glucosidilyticus TaxID=1122941 RepID=UPI0026EECB97|nr:polysaccharide lyase family 8 super-sandwich domain-containing protein [Pedobacter glucosidilyticus]
MRRLLLIILTGIQTVSWAQQRFVDFNSSIPNNWSTNSGQITLSDEHVKGGAKSLKWLPQSGSVLTANNLSIPSSEIGNFSSSCAQFLVYSSRNSTDTLLFRFYDTTGALRRQGRMLLNYTGWREYHRSYRYDYNNGNESSSFTLNRMEVVYRPSSTSLNTLYLDEMLFVGNTEQRIPGPHLRLDVQHFVVTSPYTSGLVNWLNQPQQNIPSATQAEISAIQTIRNTYNRTLTTPNTTVLQAAKDYVNSLDITTNPDGSLKGVGVNVFDEATLLTISTHCGALARAHAVNNDVTAYNLLQKLLAYLVLEQGLAEGARNVMPYNDYTASRNFPIGFLEAYPYIQDAALQAEVLKMLKWSHEFNKIYAVNPTPGQNTDFIHVKSNFLIELALLGANHDEIARDLREFSAFLEYAVEISQGALDGIKPDGTFFHHNSQHISYAYAYATWITRAFELRGTPFRISQTAYEKMCFFMKSLFLETSKGAIYPHAASGRGPFPSGVPVNVTAFERLITVGGDLLGSSFEPEMAKFYNYIFQTNRYSVANINLDGFHQFNYGQTGIMRKGRWMAAMRGFTDYMFGAEIYSEANRYGRYQSYGSLEILYDGSLASSGYITNGAGWDWNMMPGTTSLRLAYDNLKPLIAGTASEYQADNFAGALADGNYGVFGMNFIEDAGSKYTANNLKFKKSVFTFDSLLVCLGTNISATNNSNQVITTLFQGVNASSNPAIYLNSSTPTSATYSGEISTTTNPVWLVNAQTTGYYIPVGNGNIQVFRGQQSTPQHTTNNTSTTSTANASKAWLLHGTRPTSAKYHYTVVPNISPQNMNALAQRITNGEIYEVLKQTDSVHAVRYIPANIISYTCFLPQPNINVGYLKGISGGALLTLREAGDTLIVKIANPDLNAVSNATSGWVSSASLITVNLTGKWRVLNNANNAALAQITNGLNASFTLKDGFSASLVLVKDTTLPVEMNNFEGTVKPEGIALKWQSITERNTNFYTLFRSVNGIDFEPIYTIDAAKNTNAVTDYTFNDKNYPSYYPQLYYKLLLTDQDGTTSYESIISVKLSTAGSELILYPNPSDKEIFLQYPDEFRKQIRVRIHDTLGREVFDKTYSVQEQKLIQLDISTLGAGMYMISASENQTVITKKIIKK